MKNWIQEQINETIKKPLPIMTYPGLAYTGKNIIDIVTKGNDQFECIKALSGKYATAASVTVMDLSVEAEAFGAKIKISNDEVPTVVERLVVDADSINALAIPKLGSGRTLEYLKAARLAKENIKDRPVFGGIIGPYSLAGRLFDITEIMMYVLIDPDSAHELLKKATAFLKEYASAFKEAGANGIVIAEPAAGLLSADMCTEFSSGYVKEIVESVQDENFIVILHNCGNTVELVDSMLSTQAVAYHFGNAVDMLNILPQMPPTVIAMGNLDPVGVFKQSTARAAYEKTFNLLEKTKNYPNFMLSSGCDIPPGCPEENINAFFQASVDFYAKK